MKIKEWVELASISGELEGISMALEWSEDVDLKKLRESLKQLSVKVKTIHDSEADKIEDINYKKDDKKQDKPKVSNSKPLKQPATPEKGNDEGTPNS